MALICKYGAEEFLDMQNVSPWFDAVIDCDSLLSHLTVAMGHSKCEMDLSLPTSHIDTSSHFEIHWAHLICNLLISRVWQGAAVRGAAAWEADTPELNQLITPPLY